MDVFRTEYRALTAEEKARIAAIKERAAALHKDLYLPLDRNDSDMETARTRLQECVMWATKAITG